MEILILRIYKPVDLYPINTDSYNLYPQKNGDIISKQNVLDSVKSSVTMAAIGIVMGIRKLMRMAV